MGGYIFQINVGTCGSHNLLPEERGYTIADFYIGIGKLHANTELLETIKDALFYYAERIADIQKEVREVDEQIKPPPAPIRQTLNLSINEMAHIRITVKREF